ncbi:pyridoxamine 5'-phosphate oxidase family protein [Streptomyces sp. NBC_01216]|uniref:pyridoxamine 5'-phosphate oxidase family protein n=1 Tax=unclassified Streptomyces TaxID=2593676 RepID=UPI002E0F6615|nr:pyridoxamine 5'-phosphate oxidase family protein [Streptomyces sp. NBC_01216]
MAVRTGESTHGPRPSVTAAPAVLPLTPSQSLSLLQTVSLGRLVFTEHALPAVRPAAHVLRGEDVVVHIDGEGAPTALTAPDGAPGVVVAYQTDEIDPLTHLGWSVVVTGYARLVTDLEEKALLGASSHARVGPHPGSLVCVRPDIVRGFRLAERAPHQGR